MKSAASPEQQDIEANAPLPKNQSKSLIILAVVLFYFFISISLVFVNKIILSDDVTPYPITVTWFQFVVALVCQTSFGFLGANGVSALSFISPPSLNPTTAKTVLPLTLIFTAMVIFNNFCLQFVEVSFYQVARSLTLLFTILLSYFILGQPTSYAALCCCAVVVIGFIVGSIGELHFSMIGVIFGLISSFFVSLYGIYVKKVLNVLGGDQWVLLFYNSLLSVILLIPVIIVSGEYDNLSQHEGIMSQSNMTWNFIGGLFGYAINLAIFLQIKLTTPLTSNISGTTKATLQTLLAFLYFRNPVSAMNAIGIFLILAGSAVYSYLKYLKMTSTQT